MKVNNINNITKYKNLLSDSLDKVKNNSDYFNSFGDVYITKKIKEYLDNIYGEMEKINSLIIEKEDSFVEIDQQTNI